MEEISDSSRKGGSSLSLDSSMFNLSIQRHYNDIISFISLQL